jgi:tetratricopeptide (TPR) repeat protein
MHASQQAKRMLEQLTRQLGYLSRSSQLFDLGYTDEAIRIATSLRVLFHDGVGNRKNQGSIIKLLGKPTIHLISTSSGTTTPDSETIFYDRYMHLRGNIPPWKDYLKRKTSLATLAEWWTQVIFVVDRKAVTRKDLVLWAAEKDGGAHSDSQNHETYEAVMGMWIAHAGPQSQPAPVAPQHLFALRRFALEILASDELVRLATPNSINPRPDSHLLYGFEPGADPVANRALDIASYYLKNKALKETGQRGDVNKINRSLQLLHELVSPFLTWRAEEYLHLANYSAAESDFRRALEIEPTNYHIMWGLGYSLRELGRLDESEATLREVLKAAPDHHRARVTLANLYFRVDRFADAIREYDIVLTADPQSENARINRESASAKLLKMAQMRSQNVD